MCKEQTHEKDSTVEDDRLPIDKLDSSEDEDQNGVNAELHGDESDAGSEETGEEAENKIKEKKEERTKRKLIEALSEKEIRELLTAKKKLNEKTRVLEEKSKLLAEYEDLLKRKQAEFENYKKRIQRETEENRKYATAEIVLDILNIIDDLERAIKSTESSQDFSALFDGITMIERQLSGMLEKKYGVTRIESVGKPFDPTVHDAITMVESDQHEEDTVIEDFQKGYRMNDRILRHSKVKVAKAMPSDDALHADKEDNEEEKKPEKGDESWERS